jgi:cbb3-type cytochrome oxidase maturation protein
VSVIFIVVPLATLIVLVAVVAFVVSARRGQFDDLDTPAVRMLHDELNRHDPLTGRHLVRTGGSVTGTSGGEEDPAA